MLGGKVHKLGGNYFEPTLIADVQLNMQIAREEIFGPVAAIMKYVFEVNFFVRDIINKIIF